MIVVVVPLQSEKESEMPEMNVSGLQAALRDTNHAIGLLDGALKKFQGTIQLNEHVPLDTALRRTAQHHETIGFKTDRKLFARLSGKSDDPIRELSKNRLSHIFAAHGNLKQHLESSLKKAERQYERPNVFRRMAPAYAQT